MSNATLDPRETGARNENPAAGNSDGGNGDDWAIADLTKPATRYVSFGA